MSIVHGWNAHRDNLARWAMTHMVNRTDCSGAYSALNVRGTPGTNGDPIPNSYTDKHELTLARLQAHFSSWAGPEHVVGVHTISLDDTCKAVSLDVDSHSSEDDQPTAERNQRFAMAVYAELDRLGLRPLMWDSNGKGGFHIDVILSHPIPAAQAHQFGLWLVRDWQNFGFVKPPESFPKQASRGEGFGNWLRLIGRHHTRNIWAKVYDPESGNWLEGEAAALAVLAHQAVSPAAIPPEAIVVPERRKPDPARIRSAENATDDIETAIAALRVIPPTDDYDEWIRVGAASHGTSTTLLPQWEDWSRGSDKFTEGKCEQKWKTFGKDGAGLGTLIWLANQTGLNWRPRTDSGVNLDYLMGGKDHMVTEAKTANSDNTRRHNPPKPSEKRGSVNCRHYMRFPSEVFPKPVRDFIEATAKAMDCDEAYVGLPVLAVLASCIGNTRKIRLKQSWFEPAIVWTAIIGNSGTRKSPPIDAAAKPLRDRQAKALKEHEEKMKEHEGHILHYNTLVKKYKGDGDLPEQPEEPIAERLMVSDLTIEALAPILKNQPRGVLVCRDELDGWLGAFDQYKSGKGSDMANWLELHGGRSLTVDRRTGNIRTIYVPHAAASVAGGIQPGILTSKITTAHKASGLLARILTAYPPARVRKWTEADVDPRINEDYAFLVESLLAIPFETKDGEEVPGILYLTSDAKALFAQFVNDHGKEIADLEDDLTASFSKLEGYAARFALILHFSRWAAGEQVDHNQCDTVSIQAGITLSRWFANEARRVYSLLTETATETEDRKLVELIQRHGGTIYPRDLSRSCRKYPTAEDAEKALQNLVNQEAGRWVDKPSLETGGRPSRFFSLITVDSRHNPENIGENGGSVGAGFPIQASDEAEVDFDEVAQLFGGRPA